ncbi:ribosome maturation factor RimM [Stomatohabitans albus]|uniref:ribosome maturation factor RimM n=1 Tax=Stomatohabitans albus TaxID=3110766 RepID=UPI00300C1AEA
MNTVAVGRIGKPFGIRGEVYVHPETDLGDVIDQGVQLQTSGGQTLTVHRAHWHGGRFIVAFEGYTTRDDAESLRGQNLFIDRATIVLDDDMMWVQDMIGVPVVDPNGSSVGEVAGVRDGTAHDWIVLRTPDGKEHLVPHVAAIINVDVQPFVLDAPDGLLDLE